MEYIRNTRYQT